MSFDGRAIANFVLDQCASKHRALTQLSLQKIVYFCHVWSLIKLDKPLVKHTFEAWEFGPVLPYLYRDFKSFEDRPIDRKAFGLNVVTGVKDIVEYDLDAETRELLESVVDFYSQLSAADLVRMSHVEGSPWDQVWNHPGRANPGMRIEDSKIVDFYSNQLTPFSREYGTH